MNKQIKLEPLSSSSTSSLPNSPLKFSTSIPLPSSSSSNISSVEKLYKEVLSRNYEEIERDDSSLASHSSISTLSVSTSKLIRKTKYKLLKKKKSSKLIEKNEINKKYNKKIINKNNFDQLTDDISILSDENSFLTSLPSNFYHSAPLFSSISSPSFFSPASSSVSSLASSSSVTSLHSKNTTSSLEKVTKSRKLLKNSHELISNISLKASKNLPPPSYVLPLNQLDPSSLSWDNKIHFRGESLMKYEKILQRNHLKRIERAKAYIDSEPTTVPSSPNLFTSSPSKPTTAVSSNSNGNLSTSDSFKDGKTRKIPLETLTRYISPESAAILTTYAEDDDTPLTKKKKKIHIKKIKKNSSSSSSSSASVSSINSLAPINSSYSTLSSLPINSSISTLPTLSPSPSPRITINILGCNYPMDLILSKSNERVRKSKQVIRKKKELILTNYNNIITKINNKNNKKHMLEELKKKQYIQSNWLKIVQITTRLKVVSTFIKNYLDENYEYMFINRKAKIIQCFFLNNFKKLTKASFLIRFNKSFYNIKFLLYIKLRIFLKKIKIKIIKNFLINSSNRNKITKIIHNYLSSVKLIQRNIRSFLQCKRSKEKLLLIIWDKLEKKYIKEKLNERLNKIEDIKKNNLSIASIPTTSSSSNSSPSSSSKSLSPSLNQDISKVSPKMKAKLLNDIAKKKKWLRIEKKMENTISLLRQLNILKVEQKDDAIKRYILPLEYRKETIKSLLEKWRRDYLNSEKNKIKKQLEMDSTFKTSHVLDFLFNNGEEVKRILHDRYDTKNKSSNNHSTSYIKYKPFFFFKVIDKKQMLEAITEGHNIHESFVIKLDEKNNNEKSLSNESTYVSPTHTSSTIPSTPSSFLLSSPTSNNNNPAFRSPYFSPLSSPSTQKSIKFKDFEDQDDHSLKYLS